MDAWMRGMLRVAISLPALPEWETRLDFLRHDAECSAARLDVPTAMGDGWFEQAVTFSGCQRLTSSRHLIGSASGRVVVASAEVVE